VTLQLGSHGPLVSRWTDVMLKRFRSYALGVDGLPLGMTATTGTTSEGSAGVRTPHQPRRRTGRLRTRLGCVGFSPAGDLHRRGPHVQPLVRSHRLRRVHLQSQGVCYWQPVGYDVNALPFNNKSGVDELVSLIGADHLPDGTPFPPGTRGASSDSRKGR
jgi:hypothetical protein